VREFLSEAIEEIHLIRGFVFGLDAILIEKIDKRRRLCLFGQDGKSLKVREQNSCGAGRFGLHLAAPLKLLCDWRRQQVVEELLGASLFGSDIRFVVCVPHGAARLVSVAKRMVFGPESNFRRKIG
jgi:hypothetical protein